MIRYLVALAVVIVAVFTLWAIASHNADRHPSPDGMCTALPPGKLVPCPSTAK